MSRKGGHSDYAPKRSKRQPQRLQGTLHDPEPLYAALELFTAPVGAAGLVVQVIIDARRRILLEE